MLHTILNGLFGEPVRTRTRDTPQQHLRPTSPRRFGAKGGAAEAGATARLPRLAVVFRCGWGVGVRPWSRAVNPGVPAQACGGNGARTCSSHSRESRSDSGSPMFEIMPPGPPPRYRALAAAGPDAHLPDEEPYALPPPRNSRLAGRTGQAPRPGRPGSWAHVSTVEEGQNGTPPGARAGAGRFVAPPPPAPVLRPGVRTARGCASLPGPPSPRPAPRAPAGGAAARRPVRPVRMPLPPKGVGVCRRLRPPGRRWRCRS